uniref:Nucleolar and spindle associated protein 1 n=1 Tax=Catagonus wagneri TaxID=51154 RepID=A0A8C3VDL5_9CETA
MIVSSLEELDSFKYSDLQNLAKNLGLRANLRADKLLRALKAHLKNEAKEENESQDEVQTSASSCDETEVQTSSREQAEREPIGHVTKTRKRRRTLHRSADPQDHSEIKICDPPEFQSQEEHESQALQAAVEVPSVPNESQGDENAVPSGKSGINGMSNNLKKKKIQKHTHTKKRSSRHGAVKLDTSIYVLYSTVLFRFSAATQDNEHKRSLTKTPARKSPHVTTSGNTPKGQAVFGTHKLKTTAVITPFKLTTEASQTPISQRKPVFDLKASLSRPLTYEPHKGKLKPWGQSKENSSLSQHGNRVSFHKKTYKQPHLQTREEQRKKHEQERKEKKAKVLEVRRGLIMAKH